MAYVEFHPLYGILSGSTVTYVGPMSPQMQRNLTPALQKGEKLVQLDVIDVSYNKIHEIAYVNNNNLSPRMGIFAPDYQPPLPLPSCLIRGKYEDAPIIPSIMEFKYEDAPIISFEPRQSYYCIMRHGVMQVIGYFTPKIAERIADHFNTQYYEFIPSPEHVKIGEPDGTFNPINEMLRMINGDFEPDVKKNTQEQSEDTNNKKKKKKGDQKPNSEKKSTIPTRREMNKVANYDRRCRILSLIIQNDIDGLGYTQRDIAKEAGASLGLVNLISQKYDHNPELSYDDLGEKTLGRKPKPFSKIPEHIFNEIIALFSLKGPEEVGIKAYSWSGDVVVAYLASRGIHVSLQYFYKFCQRMDLTSKNVSRKNPKQNDEDVDFFTSIGFKQIVELAIKENREIVFSDEMAAMVDHHIKGYSLRNKRSVGSYSQSIKHSTHSVCTFIGLDGFFKTFLHEGSITTEDFLSFLELIKKENPGKRFLFIMDNAGIHTSKEAYDWYLSHEKFCLVRFLPKYAPQLNVVEFFNNIFKAELKKGSGLKSSEISDKAAAICHDYNSKNPARMKKVNALFSKEECSYAKKIYDDVRNTLELNTAVSA